MKLKKALSSLLALVLLLSCMSITAMAETYDYDYTIVLKDGFAYKNSASGENITSTVAGMGLSYADGVWTMNNFNFSTSASYALRIESETTINLVGENSISIDEDKANASYYGIEISANTIINGTGELKITIKDTADENAKVWGILSTKNLSVQGSVTLNITTSGIDEDGYSKSCGIDNGYGTISVSNAAKILITAMGNKEPTAVLSYVKPDATATDTSTKDLLTYNENGYTYYKGDSVATSVTLTAVNSALNSASSLTEQGGASFTVDGKAAATANKGDTVTATATPVAGYTATLTASDNVTDFDAATGTFTMPGSAVTVTATYAFSFCDITNGAPQADEATNHGYITLSAESAAEDTEITVTAYPEDGYKLDTLTYTPEGGEEAAITGGKFNMPAAAVTVNAAFSKIQTTGEDIDLDLEESDTYPDHKDIDQWYTKTEASSIKDTHRIGVTWWTDAYTTLGHKNLVVQVNNAVKWDPTTLSWVTDDALNGLASVQEGTDKVNFQLSNYSAKTFTCEISYAANTEDTYANKKANTVVFDSNNGGTLVKVENDINNPGETNSAYLDEDGQVDLTKVPTLTITGTVGVDLDGFKNANANSTAVKYGRFTVKCTAVTE